ncbi:MAG: amino acid transporter [Betaproteobacteria bacterium RIFCSPLOWO2_12_FULL_62_58]|nr:MAG: amino acid transporter [Betaproteobacteria bacterium RIFCSPLOWO2_12_FULL_62_58]
MSVLAKAREAVIGKPRDPMNPETRRHIALIAFFAWVGLGADGLSSSCYGPEEAYLALGAHTQFGLYLAVAIAVTVFIISLAYNQVIELFPNGGGGYKVATQLIGPHAGLTSGAALIVDYVLTVAISVASGADAVFSLLPLAWHPWKVPFEIAMIMVLITLNLRGMKEAIKILLPIFVGFVVVHVVLIGYGIYAHAERLPALIPATVNETTALARETSWMFVVGTMLLAYSQGGGTYTGLEAVSNNVNTLAEPRIRTGKWTMFYMAFSLAFTAGGIMLLYLLWDAAQSPGQTLNAVVFMSVIEHFDLGSPFANATGLLIVLALEGGLLFVAANTGFLGGPAVLANMAADSWVPRHFRELSSRLVTQNGILLMGFAAIGVLIWSQGSVALLVVLYSINVFLTFSISLYGLCVFWVRNRRSAPIWKRRLLLSLVGLIVTSSILTVLVVEKFTEGGWVTILITGLVIAGCMAIRRHYDGARAQLRTADALFEAKLPWDDHRPVPPLDPAAPTALLFVGKHRGVGVHALLWVLRLFPGHFKNFVFVSVGEVDAQSYAGEGALRTLRYTIENSLRYFVRYCHAHGIAAEFYVGFGIEPVEEFVKLAEQVFKKYPNAVCFASKLVFARVNFLTRWLHNRTPLELQERLHLEGRQMVLLPMKVA